MKLSRDQTNIWHFKRGKQDTFVVNRYKSAYIDQHSKHLSEIPQGITTTATIPGE